jgi:xylan 1,4-beta-xylosidase
MNPFLFNGHHHPDVQSTGHADLIQDQSGNWWAFFLAVRTQVNGRAPLGRECWLTPVVWDENEWPVFNAKKPVELQVITSLLPAQATFTGWIDQFTSSE